MTDSPAFEKPKLIESDIEKIKGEVLRISSAPENQSLPRQEIVKQSIQNIIEPEKEEDGVLPDYAKEIPQDVQMEAEQLIQTAVKEGLSKANKLAKKAHPSVADMFHDAMSKHYLELEEKGLI